MPINCTKEPQWKAMVFLDKYQMNTVHLNLSGVSFSKEISLNQIKR